MCPTTEGAAGRTMADERETRDLIIDLRGKVETLRDAVVRSENGTRSEIERLRLETLANRTEFRDDMSRRLTAADKKIDDEIRELKEQLKLKADKEIVDPMRRNLNTVVMFVITTVIGTLITYVVVNHSNTPDVPHLSGSNK